MKTNVITVTFLAGALASGTWAGLAQSTSSEPNPVIGHSADNTTSPPPEQQTTGGKITSAVENLLGRFLHHNQGDISFDQLPAAVQNTVRGQAGTAPIQSVRELNSNGQTTYVVTYNRNGQNVDLQLDPSGRILGDSPIVGASQPQARPVLSAPAPVSFYQLPVAGQKTLQQYSQGAPIQNLQKGTIQGQTVYQAAFLYNGQNIELRIDQTGALLRDPQTDQYLTSIGMFPNSNVISRNPTATYPSSAQSGQYSNSTDWRSAPARQPLTDSSLVDFNSLPQNVRNTFVSYAGVGAINNLQRGMVNGQTVYQAQLDPNGQLIDLRVTETGVLLRDQVNDRFMAELNNGGNHGAAVGRAGTWQSGGGTSSGAAPLSNSTTVGFNQLPLAVQTTINGQSNGMPIDRVTQGTVNGQTVYEVSYNQNGQWVNLRVGEDGSVLSSSPNAR